MIAIIDYGMGNAASMANMLKKIGANAMITHDKVRIQQANAIILPGVGAFDFAMQQLQALELVPVLEQKVLSDKVPFLGVCLGMQLLFKHSEEGQALGLGWLPGEVVQFDFTNALDPQQTSRLKIPHMGWNVIHPVNQSSLLQLPQEEIRAYFAHSYHVKHVLQDCVAGYCHYGYDFVCAVEKDNIFGLQFHPEKSHRFGQAMLTAFVKACVC